MKRKKPMNTVTRMEIGTCTGIEGHCFRTSMLCFRTSMLAEDPKVYNAEGDSIMNTEIADSFRPGRWEIVLGEEVFVNHRNVAFFAAIETLTKAKEGRL